MNWFGSIRDYGSRLDVWADKPIPVQTWTTGELMVGLALRAGLRCAVESACNPGRFGEPAPPPRATLPARRRIV